MNVENYFLTLYRRNDGKNDSGPKVWVKGNSKITHMLELVLFAYQL